MEQNKNKTAVILVNYNGIKDSLECIASIKKSNDVEQVDIIYVDNDSQKDETITVKEKFPDVITFRSEINGGFAAGNNIGIRWAVKMGYGYIMLLNNDTIIASDMIELLKAKCNENTVTTPKMLYYSHPDTIWYGGGYINIKTGNAKHYEIDSKDRKDTASKLCTFATGCCIMLKRETIQKVGLLDEGYFMYCEDTEYSLRLLKNGVHILYIPTARLWHKVSASTGGSLSAFSIYYVTRNRIKVIKKYESSFSFMAMPFTIFSRYIRMLQMKLKGNPTWRYFLRGIRDGESEVNGKVEL